MRQNIFAQPAGAGAGGLYKLESFLVGIGV